MFDYQGLFDSFNLPPDHTEEDIAVQMMYDTQHAVDGHVSSSSNPQQADSKASENEGIQEPVNNVDPAQETPAQSTGNTSAETINADQDSNPDVTNLDSTMIVPAHPVNKDHPQDQIVGNLDSSVRTRSQLNATYVEIMQSDDPNKYACSCFISQMSQDVTLKH